MRWVKRDSWKLIIPITSLLLFLVFMVWIPATLVDVTATMNTLQEEKLRQEIQQLESQTQNQNNWLFTSSTVCWLLRISVPK
jgi:uncharacterized membrane protein YgcG